MTIATNLFQPNIRRIIITVFAVIVLVLALPSGLSALQTDTIKTGAIIPDTTRTDTTASDTGKAPPPRVTPIPLLGSIDRSLPPSSVIIDTELNFRDYISPADLFTMENGVFFRDLGSPGQFSSLSIDGVGARGIAVLADGVPLQDPMSGAFDLNLYPFEHASRIEFISGTRAFVYAFNGTGGVINMVSRSSHAIHPFSRIRFTEGAYGFSSLDALVTQDVVRNVNITIGLEHSTTGGRYTNSNYDLWNGRIKIRYNPANRLNLYCSEMYNQTRLGLFGGVVDTIPVDERYDRNLATVVNTDAYEKITRHDVQIGAAARLLGDSTLISNLAFYHSASLREYRDEEIPGYGNGIYNVFDNRTQRYGVRFTHTLVFGRQQVDAGAELERSGVIASDITGQRLETRTAVFGKTQSTLLNPISLAGYARFDRVASHDGISAGGDGSFSPDSLFELFGGYSHSFRFPSFEERFWNDSILTTSNSDIPEQHDLFEAGIRTYHPGSITGELKFFHRTIHDAYILLTTGASNPFYTMKTINQRTIRGISAELSVRFGVILAEGSGQYMNMNDSSDALLPEFSGMGGLYYRNTLLDGHLDLKFGVRGRLVPSYSAPTYDPEIQRFLPDRTSATETAGVVDIVLIAHMGDAYLHFIYDNFFDRQYIITTFYPMPDSDLRLGVSWNFND